MKRSLSYLLPLALALGACSTDDLDDSGGSASATINGFEVRGTNGSSQSPQIDTTAAAPFALLWNTQARSASSDIYRVEAELVGANGDIVRWFQRNCGDVGIDTGCERGNNEFPCTVDPNSGSPVLACPPGENASRTNVNSFFARNQGLPANYTVRLSVCVFDAQVNEICDTASRSVTFY